MVEDRAVEDKNGIALVEVVLVMKNSDWATS
jgi:hypothetical protein